MPTPLQPRLALRPYQRAALENHSNGIEVWMWGRQTGKSFTLACWAVERLLSRPGRLVTILSNSLANGAELQQKCAQVARLYQQIFAAARPAESGCLVESSPAPGLLSDPAHFDCLTRETRITVAGQVGRIKILPANPRTARGFSGDLILDEFAFHQDSTAIWEAAEPILSANPDFLCRIASTPSGRHNMFYRLMTDPQIPHRILPRSEAWRQGLIISHPVTRQPITPEEARALALDKRAYDQNYECIFESENTTLLTHELISAAEDPSVGLICDDRWSDAAQACFRALAPRTSQCQLENAQCPMLNDPPGPPRRTLYIGVDVGRSQDLTVITALEKHGDTFFLRALLRLRNLRLPQQQELLEVACRSPRFAAAEIDMTGLGLGLYEYTHQKFGSRVRGINFASSLPLGKPLPRAPRAGQETARAPEVLALTLLGVFESRCIRHPIDPLLREDLLTPERITTAEGRVSIVASRGQSGHADHFWSLALALHAATSAPLSSGATTVYVRNPPARLNWTRSLQRGF